ncbi:ABC transporter permease [Nocardia sp. NPDC048505]|uniref:ABC transporter permease n=1 Tax=unclassified Nocardia TaxID=2637762 RepID=UPI0033DF24B0
MTGDKLARFRASPYFPASVLVLILTAAAALFAGSYTYAMAKPTPRNVPIAVVNPQGDSEVREFLGALNRNLNGALDAQEFGDRAGALTALESQRVFAIVEKRPAGVGVDVAGASGASVAELLTQQALAAGAATRVPTAVTDLVPLQPGDPRGLGMFYITLAAIIVGFVGAIQLNVHAGGLPPAVRVAFIAAYALCGGFAITATVDWALGALSLVFPESGLILALTMFTAGMVFTMFNTLFGRWAMVPTWVILVLLGNPSSGGAVSWPLLPSVLAFLGQWLPPGASIEAQHTAVYFHDHQRWFPFLVLAGWSLLTSTIYLFAERRKLAKAADTPTIGPLLPGESGGVGVGGAGRE